jgi:hypothetical protein
MTRLVTGRLSAVGMFAASTLLHIVALRTVPERALRVDGARPEPASVDFEVGTLGAVRAPEPTAAVPEAELVLPSARRRAAQPEPRTDPPATAMRSEAAGPDGLAVSSAAPAAHSRAGLEAYPPPVPAFDLDPRRAALGTLIDSDRMEAASVQPGDLARRRGAELSASLKALGNDNPRRRRSAPPALVHHDDGSCSYTGDAIRATILPDGRVRFDDKRVAVSLGMLQPLGAGDSVRSGAPEPPGLAMTPEDTVLAQPSSVVVKVAGRAWDAERSWFLRETASMRAELADAARARELAGVEHALRKQLDRIWCATSVPPQDRRREMFSLWDNTSGDEEGARGRRAIEQYMRENLPRGSALAFPVAQLAELNSNRAQREAFDPYGAGRGDAFGGPR